MDKKSLIIILSVLILLNVGLLTGLILNNSKKCFKANETKPSNNMDAKTRIVGGQRVAINSYPHMAGIIIRKRSGMPHDMLQCGCSIISTNWVVTAAHCIMIILEQHFRKNMVYISSTNSKWTKGKQHDVEEWICHEDYDDIIMSNDIALMRVKQPFTGFHEKPIAIANKHYGYKRNTLVMVTGWGLQHENADETEEELRGVKVKIVEQKQCQTWYNEEQTDVTQEMFCAGYSEGGKDACQFDSGGPIVDKKLLIGIVSWGVGCAKEHQPGVYTRISLYEKWITDTARKLHHPLHGAVFKKYP